MTFLSSGGFNAMSYQNKGLSDVQCLGTLLEVLPSWSCRRSSAYHSNYSSQLLYAYNALVERYENQSLIIQPHIRSLFQTPQVQRSTASELRQLHHHVIPQVNALQTLGQNVH